jgi:hypothetical protein
MTANHVEHEIATFPGSPGRGGQQRRAIKREAEEDWGDKSGERMRWWAEGWFSAGGKRETGGGRGRWR